MKSTSVVAAAFALVAVLAGVAAPAETILYSFTGLPGSVDTCKWFDDNLNQDRSVNTLTRQTDLLYNRIALPVDAPVTIGRTATTAAGAQLVDFNLQGKLVCTGAEAIYGPAPSPSGSASPLPT
jgi:uncharacterized membrane protein YuzA (DUF378 family)